MLLASSALNLLLKTTAQDNIDINFDMSDMFDLIWLQECSAKQKSTDIAGLQL